MWIGFYANLRVLSIQALSVHSLLSIATDLESNDLLLLYMVNFLVMNSLKIAIFYF